MLQQGDEVGEGMKRRMEKEEMGLESLAGAGWR